MFKHDLTTLEKSKGFNNRFKHDLNSIKRFKEKVNNMFKLELITPQNVPDNSGDLSQENHPVKYFGDS